MEAMGSVETPVSGNVRKNEEFLAKYDQWKKDRIAQKMAEIKQKLEVMREDANQAVEAFYSKRTEENASRMSANQEEELKSVDEENEEYGDDKEVWTRVFEVLNESAEFKAEYKKKKKMIDLITEKMQ